MFVPFMLIFMLAQLCDSQKLLLPDDNPNLTTCVQNIIMNWIKKGTDITYVDFNYQDNDVVKVIHKTNLVTVISKSVNIPVDVQHNAYIVTIENFITFKNEITFLTNEWEWKPDANMVLVFRKYEPDKITDLFKILLRLHIFDVVVIYVSNEAPIYTYNPFQNKNCGKTFREIVKYDNCSELNLETLFFYKPVKNLKGCTFNVGASHWPPFTINPDQDHMKVKLNGTEQYLMQILSNRLGFNLTYKYVEKGEEFPIIHKNKSATGGLGLLQKGSFDIIIGGMILTHQRANAFSYFHGHHDFEDELSVLVKKSGPVPTWKNIYLEFTCLVWILLVVTFVMFFAVISISFSIKDKCNLILIMWDFLFQHGHKLRLKLKGECFLFQWVIFAFMINTYYQSNLSGLTTHISYNYQISKFEDIEHFKIQPCLSPLINSYSRAITGHAATNETNEECNSILNSIRVVSKDYTKYTVVLLSIYQINNYKFRDESGEFLLYKLPTPKSKLIYAVYFNKGFPMLRHLYYQVQRIRETGLLDKKTRDINYEITREFYATKDHLKAPFILPWQVLVIGYGLSSVTFLIETIMDYMKRKSRPGTIFLH